MSDAQQAVKGPTEIHHCIYCQKVISGVHQGEGVGTDGKQVFSCNECWQSNFIKQLYRDVNAAEAERDKARAHTIRLKVENMQMREVIRGSRVVLAALIADPRDYGPDKWPVKNWADAVCLETAYETLLEYEDNNFIGPTKPAPPSALAPLR